MHHQGVYYTVLYCAILYGRVTVTVYSLQFTVYSLQYPYPDDDVLYLYLRTGLRTRR